MHELSIAVRVVEQAAAQCRAAGGARVLTVTLRIGRLACIHAEALRFGFEHCTIGTLLGSAELRIVDAPVRIWCPACSAEVELPGIQRLACPTCRTPSGDIRGGRELDIESIEILDAEEQLA